jgi:hypothetical protein
MTRLKEFSHECIYRYDDKRPDRGTMKKDKSKDEGESALIGRCSLIKHGNRKCLFPEKDHLKCRISIAEKPKKKKRRQT